ADIVLLCCNTLHKYSQAIIDRIGLPFMPITEVIGKAIVAKKLKKVGLLGSKPTMEEDFYKNIFVQQFGLDVLTPNLEERNYVDRVIRTELIQGKISDHTRRHFQKIIGRLVEAGAEGVILGCTEIPLLIRPEDVDIPVFDSTKIHAEAAVDWVLQDLLIAAK
ncbi:MAG: amino acid racemase, partial [Bacteroidota bacterium]